MSLAAIYNLYGIYSHPMDVYVGAGIFDEPVNLTPDVRVVGQGPSETTIQYFETGAAENIVVNGARGAALEQLTITLPELLSATTALLRIDDVPMVVDGVVFDGKDNLFSVAVLISGDGTSAGVIRHSVFRRLDFGIRAVDSAINIFDNEFEAIREDAVFVRLPETKQAGDPSSTPVLGRAGDPETGNNKFRSIQGSFVVNMSTVETKAEMNDWGYTTEAEIRAKMFGPVDFLPFVGQAAGEGEGEGEGAGEGEGGGEGEGAGEGGGEGEGEGDPIGCSAAFPASSSSPGGDLLLSSLAALLLVLVKRRGAQPRRA